MSVEIPILADAVMVFGLSCAVIVASHKLRIPTIIGFLRDEVPPGMIYRHLRQMEEEKLVVSQWEAEGSGPAKRVYVLTPEGGEVLEAWVAHMERKARRRLDFTEAYHRRASKPQA